MQEHPEALIEVVAEWVKSKGVAVWPSVSGDTQDEKEARMLAEWFMDQVEDWDTFMYQRALAARNNQPTN